MDLQINRLPLELNGYFFPECDIKLFPLANKEEKYRIPERINITTSANQTEEHPEIWEISVRVQTIKENAEDKFNLEFDVHALGLFKNIDRSEENEMVHNLIRLNGSAILLGAIRERIAAATGTSPFGPFFLPSLAMSIGEDETSDETEDQATQQNSVNKG